MGRLHGISDPAVEMAEVVPNDGADLPSVSIGGETFVYANALMVATPGDIHMLTGQDTEITRPVPVGVLPGKVKKVFATGTTATGITALY